MRRPFIVGNWKMYKILKEAKSLAEDLKKGLENVSDLDIAIAPPFTSLYAVSLILKDSNVALAAQDTFWEREGAFTGEVSPLMLKDLGCEYVIIGHSERRAYGGETNLTVNRKVHASFKEALSPIVCVGETLEEREKGLTLSLVETQVREGLEGLKNSVMIERITIAYEPIWAIGTGKTATPLMAEEVHSFIRKILGLIYGEELAQRIRILYGGSVKPDNIKDLMACANIDGALVGGASLDAGSFLKIVNYSRGN